MPKKNKVTYDEILAMIDGGDGSFTVEELDEIRRKSGAAAEARARKDARDAAKKAATKTTKKAADKAKDEPEEADLADDPRSIAELEQEIAHIKEIITAKKAAAEKAAAEATEIIWAYIPQQPNKDYEEGLVWDEPEDAAAYSLNGCAIKRRFRRIREGRYEMVTGKGLNIFAKK